MQYKVTKKYLVLPINESAKIKKLSFCSEDGVCVFDLNVKLDFINPEYMAYADMTRFIGDTLEVSCTPEIDFVLKQKNNAPHIAFRESYRPRVHFTAPSGWINDPNGLVYSGGYYHMFYQTNPVGRSWGNMHWGHAVSKNLLDWTDMPLALFPDTLGAMWSGSAIPDDRNLLELKDSEKTPILLFYTAAACDSNLASKGKAFTQCIAVSTDGGQSFVKSPSNPLLPNMSPENRDPKVVYSTRFDLYVMSLFLYGSTYALFTSKDLKKWNKIQEINLDGDSECPAFFPMIVGEEEEKWVFMGAGDRYITGDFDGESFTPDPDCTERSKILQPSLPTCSSGAYAAQRFENDPDGRCIRLAWLHHDFSSCGASFNHCMSLPQELTLIKKEGGEYVLLTNPAKEVEKLRDRHDKAAFREREFSHILRKGSVAYDITLLVKPAENSAGSVKFSVFGLDFTVDTANGIFSVGKVNAPLAPLADGTYKLRFITDICGAEFFLGSGEKYVFVGDTCDEGLNTLHGSADFDAVVKFSAHRLRKIKRTFLRKIN